MWVTWNDRTWLVLCTEREGVCGVRGCCCSLQEVMGASLGDLVCTSKGMGGEDLMDGAGRKGKAFREDYAWHGWNSQGDCCSGLSSWVMHFIEIIIAAGLWLDYSGGREGMS